MHSRIFICAASVAHELRAPLLTVRAHVLLTRVPSKCTHEGMARKTKRTHQLKIRISPEERATLLKLSRGLGLSISGTMRLLWTRADRNFARSNGKAA